MLLWLCFHHEVKILWNSIINYWLIDYIFSYYVQIIIYYLINFRILFFIVSIDFITVIINIVLCV